MRDYSFLYAQENTQPRTSYSRYTYLHQPVILSLYSILPPKKN